MGNKRRGPRVTPPCSPSLMKCTSLSPPKPWVRIATASTIVRYGPTRAPPASIAGRPLRNTAMSVVVPPMSDTSAWSAPVIHRAPTIDAAGPLRIVSIGRSRACTLEINAPSPRTTIIGAVMPMSFKTSSARPIKRSIIPIKRAFKTAVKARFGPFNLADN